MLILLVLFISVQLSVQLVLPMQTITQSGSSLLDDFANAILPRPWSDVSVIIVIVSTLATIETSLLVASRTLLSMSRDGVIGEEFGAINPRFQTPWFGSILMGAISLALFAAAAASKSITNVLNESVNAIGIYIAFYYGLSAIACVRYYRSEFAHDRQALWLKGIWPLAGSAFLWIVVVAQLIAAGWRASLVTLGLLALGVIPLLIYRRQCRSGFYDAPLEVAAGISATKPR